MLQSIQYVGSGPPTYVYSQKAVGASGEYYHVVWKANSRPPMTTHTPSETRGYDGRKEDKHQNSKFSKEELENEITENEEFKVLDNRKLENLQEVYQKEYGRRESFLWKQK